MTNEELAVAIQNGDRWELLELWSNVRGMVLKNARRWAGLGGTSLDDMQQAGAVAMLRAVDSFDSTKGAAFTTHLFPLLRKEFSLAAGQTTSRTRRDPLQTATSLDTPINDDEDGETFGDLLPDPSAEAAILEVAETDWEDRRRAAVEEAINSLPEAEQTAIRRKYYYNVSVDRLAHDKALRMLRHPSRSRALRAYW